MNIIQSILTNNPCYKAGRKIMVKGLMIHSVGCPQPKASVFVNLWNKSSFNSACVHAFIDGNTGDIYQCLPWDHRGWHGGGSSNNTHIGVEMCEPSTIKYTGGSSFNDLNPVKTKETVLRTYNAAVELFAYLCEQYGLNPMTDIISHAEGCKLGIASNHGDPEHLWKYYGLSMDGFRNAVKAQMNKGGVITSPKEEKPVSGNPAVLYKVQVFAGSKSGAEDALKKAKAAGFSDAFISVVNQNVSVEPVPVKKSVDEIAKEVIQGKWGSGDDRKNRLTTAGYDYPTVQKRVNEMLK